VDKHVANPLQSTLIKMLKELVEKHLCLWLCAGFFFLLWVCWFLFLTLHLYQISRIPSHGQTCEYIIYTRITACFVEMSLLKIYIIIKKIKKNGKYAFIVFNLSLKIYETWGQISILFLKFNVYNLIISYLSLLI
jgi:hypothetical protein